MTIEINDTNTIEEIRDLFSRNFPYLSLEFFAEPHRWQETSSFKHLLPHYKRIGEVSTRHHQGVLEIAPWQKTGAVEQAFSRIFGLQVQVFRLHGDRWIQTAGTDECTLAEQNETGCNAFLAQ